MEYLPMLNLAANAAAQAAGVARLPGAVRDLASAVSKADSAAALTQKAAGLLTSAAPMLKGPVGQAVSRAAGIIDLASKDLSAAGAQVLQEAGARLGAASGMLKRAIGSSLGNLAGGLSVQNLARSALSAAGLKFDDAPAASFQLEIAGERGQLFRFALGQAAFDQLRRSSKFNTPAQERLQRTQALQAVSRGGNTLTLSGAIFLAAHGSGHLNALRAIGDRLEPVTLTTGYGELLGRWYLNSIDEEQDHFFKDGAPRKQSFTLEFGLYGDDYQNL